MAGKYVRVGYGLEKGKGVGCVTEATASIVGVGFELQMVGSG